MGGNQFRGPHGRGARRVVVARAGAGRRGRAARGYVFAALVLRNTAGRDPLRLLWLGERLTLPGTPGRGAHIVASLRPALGPSPRHDLGARRVDRAGESVLDRSLGRSIVAAARPDSHG